MEPLALGALAAGTGGLALGVGGLGLAGLAASGALAGSQLAISGRQERLDLATIEANKEEAKLAAAQQALSNARGFRKALASQLALANFRGGPGSSIAAQFGTESISSFFQDQAALDRASKQIERGALISGTGAALGRTARDIGTVGGFGTSLLGATSLSRVKAATPTGKGR